MAEEPQNLTDRDAPPSTPPVSRGQQRRRQRSVFQYITILFAAALVLLLYTFMMERRQFEIQQQQDQANISDLEQQSTSAVQRLETLVSENEQLKEQLEEQTAELEKLQEQYDEIAGHSITQEKELVAWSSFWGLESDFLAKDYEACAAFFRELPADNVPYPDGQGVQERVEEIYAQLLRRGVLAEGEGWMTLEPEDGEQAG